MSRRLGLAAAVLGAFATSVASPGLAAEPLPPNEAGRVMILEYHKIDQPEERWTRTPDNFRRDLRRLWEKGYRLIALTDYLEGKISVPRGTTPAILTFDDSSPGQFRYLERAGEPVLDPECGLGILEAFAREHPEFGRAATFYVLPGANPPNRLFNQPQWAGKKLAYLAANGYEIGNHTLWHANLARYPEDVVRKQIAGAQEWVARSVPDYKLRTLALPMGAYPKDVQWAVSGTANGVTYRNEAILMVAGGPAPSPHARGLDRHRLPRIQAVEADLGYWLAHFDRQPGERYVSDGDPATITVVKGMADKVRAPSGIKIVERP